VKILVHQQVMVMEADPPYDVVTMFPGLHSCSFAHAAWILANWGQERQMERAPIRYAERGDTVAVIRDMGLGDVLMVTPTIRAFAERGCIVHAWTLPRYAALFDHNPHVAEVHTVDGRMSAVACELDFDLNLCEAVERHPDAGQRNRTQFFADLGEVTLSSRRPAYFATPEEIAAAEERWGPARPRIACVARTYAKGERSWPFMEEFANSVGGDGANVACLGGTSEECFSSPCVRNLGGIGLRETIAVLATADVCVTPDTGLLYAAVAVGCPVLAIFGCWPPFTRVEGYDRVRTLDANAILGRGYCCDHSWCDGSQMRAVTVPMARAEVERTLAEGVNR